MRLAAYLMTRNQILLDDKAQIRAKNFSMTGSNLLCLRRPVMFISVAKVTKIVRHRTDFPDVRPRGWVIEASRYSCTEEGMTMRTLMLTTLAVALALLIGAHWAAAQQTEKTTAKLTGDAEVPGPGDPMGSGTAQVTLYPDKGEVCYELSVANIQEATAAHLHEGAMGKEGPVKVALEAPKTGSAKGCAKADGPVIMAIMKDPAGYYVNIHNAAFPKGAIRGQLSK